MILLDSTKNLYIIYLINNIYKVEAYKNWEYEKEKKGNGAGVSSR